MSPLGSAEPSKKQLFTTLGASERSKHRHWLHLVLLSAQNTAIDCTWCFWTLKTPPLTALGASERSKQRYLLHLVHLNAQNIAIYFTWCYWKLKIYLFTVFGGSEYSFWRTYFSFGIAVHSFWLTYLSFGIAMLPWTVPSHRPCSLSTLIFLLGVTRLLRTLLCSTTQAP